MKRCLFILSFLFIAISFVHAQRSGGRGERGGFSLSNLASAANEVPDSLLMTDSVPANTTIIGYRLTPRIGDRYIAPMDTAWLNSSQSTLPEVYSVAVGHLANLGSPIQTKIFSERREARDFIFADAYDYYITTPENAYFYDAKVPFTNVTYTWRGGALNREDLIKGVLTTNFGKKVNVGGEMNYTYPRGYYDSNGGKSVSYRLFGSYRADKYELNAYLSNYNFVNYENGGLRDDTYVTNPDSKVDAGGRAIAREDFPVRMRNTWNRVRGKQYFLNHRYNLGFYRTLSETDEEGEPIEIFVPVSSLIHTLEYEDNRRHFTSTNNLDSIYNYKSYGISDGLSDRTSAWNLKNTFALSLREGFQDWVKAGLTVFATFEKRRFKMPTEIPGLSYDTTIPDIRDIIDDRLPDTFDFPRDEIHDEFSTFIGAELAKRQGSLFTFNARGELGILGDDLGEVRINGDIQSTFPLFNKEASVKALGYFKNVKPAFYQRHFHSRYFWWDNSFNDIQQFYVGGEVELQSTGTKLSAGAEFIENYVYFGADGYPYQHGSNLQVVTARLKQDFRVRAFGWENEVVYQLSSDKDVLPLPDFSAYSNIYVHFKLFKVLTFQLGADVHYHTKYYAPYYEPATQQFQLQPDTDVLPRTKVGNYPLMNAYLNMHLKQARFYIMGYNLSSLFAYPNYFSLAHYPLDPMVLKFGVSVVFNN